MKILIAIASCANHLNRNTAVHETWAALPLNVSGVMTEKGYEPDRWVQIKLFTGKDLEVPDDYASLPAKVKAICEYASDNDFDFVFKADSDTYVFLDRLLASGFDPHDYTGWTSGMVQTSEDYASGGAGYWLSRKAFEIVAKAKLTNDTCEDRWVGRVLYDAGIRVHRDTRYGVPQSGRKPFIDKELLTWHPASPKTMYELHKQAR